MENTIVARAGYGIVEINADRDIGPALVALLASLGSNGTVSIVTNPRLDSTHWLIQLHLKSGNRA